MIQSLIQASGSNRCFSFDCLKPLLTIMPYSLLHIEVIFYWHISKIIVFLESSRTVFCEMQLSVVILRPQTWFRARPTGSYTCTNSREKEKNVFASHHLKCCHWKKSWYTDFRSCIVNEIHASLHGRLAPTFTRTLESAPRRSNQRENQLQGLQWRHVQSSLKHVLSVLNRLQCLF